MLNSAHRFAINVDLAQDNAPLIINARHRENLTSALRFLAAFLGEEQTGESACLQL